MHDDLALDKLPFALRRDVRVELLPQLALVRQGMLRLLDQLGQVG